MTTNTLNHTYVLTIITILLLGACNRTGPNLETPDSGSTPILVNTTPSSQENTPTEEVSVTASPIIPTATEPIPAIKVNDDKITIDEFALIKARFLSSDSAQGMSDPDAAQAVIQDQINQILLAQGAEAAGFVVGDELLETRLNSIIEKAGGIDPFNSWLETMNYTPESFRADLKRTIAAAWMRDQIIGTLPETADQVHARQILLYNFDEAQGVLDRLESGTSFDDLLRIYEPINLGELGWFPKDYLLTPQIEQAAFNLNPGEYSEIIETELGFHIIQVIERDPQHPLDPDVRLALQEKLIHNWLSEKEQRSDILVSIP